MTRPIAGAELDHVAVAVERWQDAWPRYVAGLGGRWKSGGQNVGFAPSQLRFANGARLELLAPFEPQHNDFLRRFLDRSGPGPHHLTFKVPDLDVALAAAEEAGFHPTGIDRSDPGWKEAFLHPKEAGGVVVQLAQSSDDWESDPPPGFPTPNPAPAALRRVTHCVADLAEGEALFAGLLGGTVVDRPTVAGQWSGADLAWGGPLRVRLVAPAGAGGEDPLAAWLGTRRGRVLHLVFAVPAAAGGAGEVPGVLGEDVTEVVEPADNLGTRLVVVAGAP